MKTHIAKMAAACCIGILAVACGGQNGSQGSTETNAASASSTAPAVTTTAGGETTAAQGSTAVANTLEPSGATSTAQAPTPQTTSDAIPGPYRQGSGRLENQILPAGARPVNEAAKLAPENFNQYDLLYANDAASDAFAFEVHKGFLATSPSSVTSGAQFDAYSPTTGETYRVTCEQGPKFTTCSTGTGAMIYII